ncbi:uncharacterized protein [Leuresthes tenuis]|uniref:uncharacterized protein n=1 Tax=Leuresthes tenuis TaxID=355514 RepID=UPI003B50EF3C
MFFQFVLLVVSFMSFLCICSASSCDTCCTHVPEFTPSRLVVKYGDQANATCVACKDDCNFKFSLFSLEKPVGTISRDSETKLSWSVDKLTEWDPPLICYFFVNNVQCLSNLPVTVYQPPQEVSISFVNHTGPMREGGRYTLQCDVLNVAPIKDLTVTFYRGQTALGHLQSSNTNKKLVNESFTLSFSASKEDDGAEFWCEAKLELGPQGPQPPPVVKSGNLPATVHNKSCTKCPEFTPSRLVVKYGDQDSASCVACKDDWNFSFSMFGLKNHVGTSSKDKETKLSWSPYLVCYFSVNNVQCLSNLPVTVYQPPQEVSISFVNHTGPMREGGRYTLQCDVLNVAPIKDLTVTFYRGQTALGHLQSSNTNEKLVNESFTLSFSASKEDDGAEFWCEAKLELGPEGPQPPPVVKSGNLPATVYILFYLRCTKLAERMFFQFVLLVVSFMSFLCICSASSCDTCCTHVPEITPSRLVVKYGDQANATCVACKDDCNFSFSLFKLENPVGTISRDSETKLSWSVDKLTEWDPALICYFSVNNVQCLSNLPVTVYQPPQEVSISFVNHTGPMREGGRYTLQCDVLNVAPIKDLTVTFYRGQTALGHLQSSNTNKKLVNESFTLSFSASKEDAGAEFWCEAKLELGPEGPQPHPVVKSGNLPATVHRVRRLVTCRHSVHPRNKREEMFLFHTFLVFFLLNSLPDSQVSGFDNSCTHVPEFTPSRLVVKYGDQANATCVACKDDCNFKFSLFSLEKPVGTISRDSETKLSWSVDKLTEWDPALICYFFVNDVQCLSNLPVTVYQPPQEVSINFVNHTGPMREGGRYTLQCDVLNVAPIKDLTVTFYRGQTALGHLQSSNINKKLVNESFTLSYNASKEDDGAEFWCEAKLELGPEGPQPHPVVKSGNLPATVHYGPVLDGSGNRERTIKEGETLQLNCSAVGNPEPSYTWILPFSGKPYNDSVLTVGSVGLEHKGEYICKVNNSIKEIPVTFNIQVEPKPSIIILIVLIVAATFVFSILLLIGYFLCYRPNRMGQYNLKDVFRYPMQHIAVPMK